jgi:hypothetical protein
MDFEINGHQFRADKLSAREQFHLSRKLSVLLPPLGPLIEKARSLDEKQLLGADLFEFITLAQPFADALAAMKEEDADAVLDITLRSVKVQTNENPPVWMPLWTNRRAPIVELNEISQLMPVMLKVVWFNLGNFIDGFLTRPGTQEPVLSGAPSQMAKTGF